MKHAKRGKFNNNKYGKYGRPQPPAQKTTGELTCLPSGKGGVVASELGEIFVPGSFLKDAVQGDVVEVEVRGGKGKILRVVRSQVSELTGIYVQDFRFAKVIPDDRRFTFDVAVPPGSARPNDRVVVRLSRKDRHKGEVVRNLGQSGTLDADIARELFSLGLEEFKSKALAEAESAAQMPIELGERRDFTAQPCFTVDGEGSKDFDDAVYAERTEDGFKLWVHIADVAHYVPLHSHVDKEAFVRGNSFYYGESVIPMLPESLCNGVCSLNENENRYTLSAVMDISRGGEIVGGEIVEGVIRSHKRMTYENADLALAGKFDGYAPFIGTLEVLKELRDVLKSRRDSLGNIDFDIAEPKFTFVNGEVVGAERAPRLVTHSIIEECMIAANSFVAAKMHSIGAPFVYREHLPPTDEKLETLNAYLAAIGLKSVKPTSESVSALLKGVDESIAGAVSRMTLRSMSKARYSTECKGHFGLAIKEYCHFTSPIRRYSDLTVHRVIKANLSGESLKKFEGVVSESAQRASEREVLCERAERNIDDLYMCEYMAQFVGKTFDGVVCGITQSGMFVELPNTAEGLVLTDSHSSIFEEETMTMRLSRVGVFGLGDKVKVKLIEAEGGNLTFSLVFA